MGCTPRSGSPAASSIRRVIVGLLLASLALALGPRRSRAESAGGDEAAFVALRRQVIVSDTLIAPLDDFPSSQVMLAVLRRLARKAISEQHGFWRVHFVAFVQPAPETDEVRAVMTDVTDPARRRQIKVFEAQAQPGAREVTVNDLVLTEDMGFERDHRYELAVIPGGDGPPSGKTDVLARGMVTLR